MSRSSARPFTSALNSSSASASLLPGAKRTFTFSSKRSGTTFRAWPPVATVADITSKKE